MKPLTPFSLRALTLTLSISVLLSACQTPPLTSIPTPPQINNEIAPLPKGPRQPVASASPLASLKLPQLSTGSKNPLQGPSLPFGPGTNGHGGSGSLPGPVATSDISVVEKSSFQGKVYDADGAPVDRAKVTVRSLNSSVQLEASTITAGGTYGFNNIPAGVQVEIIVIMPDQTVLRRVEVLKSNKQGDPNANRYDFDPAQAIDPQASPQPTPSLTPTPTPIPQPTAYPTPVPTPTPTPVPTPVPPTDSDYYYFSYDDSASTAGVELSKAALARGQGPDPSWVRPWEFLNAEDFSQSAMQQTGLFKVSIGLQKQADVEHAGYDSYTFGAHVSAPQLDRHERRNLVLTIVLDVSGSMDEPSASEGPSKLSLAKTALRELYASLKPGDVVNLVSFADQAEHLLRAHVVGTDNAQWEQTVAALNTLGGTHLDAGMREAYATARQHYDRDKINRVLMLTDAYANIGETDPNRVAYFTRIEQSEGIYFSGLGFGQNFNEAFLDQLTEAGRGAYFSIINERDARRAVSERFMALINVAARNVRFRLDYPAALQRFQSASEESSKIESHVQPTNFSFNTSQYFLEQFIAPGQLNLMSQKLRLTIFYTDPVSGQNRVELVEKTLAEIFGQDLDNINDARLVTLLTGLLKGEVSPERARRELEAIGTRPTALGREYRALIETALKLQPRPPMATAMPTPMSALMPQASAMPTPMPQATSDI